MENSNYSNYYQVPPTIHCHAKIAHMVEMYSCTHWIMKLRMIVKIVRLMIMLMLIFMILLIILTIRVMIIIIKSKSLFSIIWSVSFFLLWHPLPTSEIVKVEITVTRTEAIAAVVLKINDTLCRSNLRKNKHTIVIDYFFGRFFSACNYKRTTRLLV